MITGKQRAFLKGMANTIDPIFQLGKNGVSESFIKQIVDTLEVREILKVKVLNNSLLDVTEVANQIAEETNSELVQSIGSKFVLYKESKENKKINLPR